MQSQALVREAWMWHHRSQLCQHPRRQPELRIVPFVQPTSVCRCGASGVVHKLCGCHGVPPTEEGKGSTGGDGKQEIDRETVAVCYTCGKKDHTSCPHCNGWMTAFGGYRRDTETATTERKGTATGGCAACGGQYEWRAPNRIFIGGTDRCQCQ